LKVERKFCGGKGLSSLRGNAVFMDRKSVGFGSEKMEKPVEKRRRK